MWWLSSNGEEQSEMSVKRREGGKGGLTKNSKWNSSSAGQHLPNLSKSTHKTKVFSSTLKSAPKICSLQVLHTSSCWPTSCYTKDSAGHSWCPCCLLSARAVAYVAPCLVSVLAGIVGSEAGCWGEGTICSPSYRRDQEVRIEVYPIELSPLDLRELSLLCLMSIIMQSCSNLSTLSNKQLVLRFVTIASVSEDAVNLAVSLSIHETGADSPESRRSNTTTSMPELNWISLIYCLSLCTSTLIIRVNTDTDIGLARPCIPGNFTSMQSHQNLI